MNLEITLYLLDIITLSILLLFGGAMAKFKHEITNRRILAKKDQISYDWRTITCVYPRKCDICNEWIEKNTKILWNVNSKNVMHQNCV